MECSHLAQDSGKWRDVVNTVMNRGVPLNALQREHGIS